MKKNIKKRKQKRRPGRTLTFQPTPEVRQQLEKEWEKPGVKKSTLINALLKLSLKGLSDGFGKHEGQILSDLSEDINQLVQREAVEPPKVAETTKEPLPEEGRSSRKRPKAGQ